MGLYLRKSVRVGPLRFNLSGSGIGVSCGIPGFRIGTGPRGNYIHAGHGGIYYRKTFSPGNTRSPGIKPPNPQPIYQPGRIDPTIGQLEAVDTGTSAIMQDASSQSLLDELNQKHHRVRLWPWVLLLGIASLALSVYLGLPELVIALIACVFVLAVIVAAYRDTLKKTTVLLYDFDDEVLGAFANLDAAFNQANASQCIWHLKAKAAVLDRKYHAGASSVFDTENIRLSKSAPAGVKTNILPMATPLGKKTLYFFPDRVLVVDAVGFGAVDYQSLRVELEKSAFITGDRTAPSDARVIRYTWRYVNKRDGGPDHRFSNNPQLPVIETADLTLSNDSGFYSKLKFSNVSGADALMNGIHQFAAVVAGTPEHTSPSSVPQAPPVPAESSEVIPHSKARSAMIAAILLVAMAIAAFAFYYLRNPTTSPLTSHQNEPVRKSATIPPVPAVTPSATPSVPTMIAISSPTVPTVSTSSEGNFVRLISPVTVRNASGKRITLRSGSRFPLSAVQHDQVVIRYFDGRDYSIPISATDRR
jgi:Protein of unknown function (DUF4236)